MFLVQISGYDDPALDVETEELLRQRLEAHSRKAVPKLWKMTDSLNTCAAKGPGREKRRLRYCVYGVVLLALGIFALISGLMEPGTPSLILVGGFAIFGGFLNFLLVREKKPQGVPAICRREAKQLLAGRRAVDWSKTQTKVSFDEAGMTVIAGEDRNFVPYDKITNIFETAHLWLFVYDGEKALLLQKKDLVSGKIGDFSILLHETWRIAQ